MTESFLHKKDGEQGVSITQSGIFANTFCLHLFAEF
jgi:hypothetical protein